MIKVLIAFMIAVTIIGVTFLGGWIIYRMSYLAGDRYAEWSDGIVLMVVLEGALLLLTVLVWAAMG